MIFKKLSRSQRVIDLMKRPMGASNRELNKIMFRYSALICSLRKDGHTIRTEQIKVGYFRYYMED
jgi:hypothetical protein